MLTPSAAPPEVRFFFQYLEYASKVSSSSTSFLMLFALRYFHRQNINPANEKTTNATARTKSTIPYAGMPGGLLCPTSDGEEATERGFPTCPECEGEVAEVTVIGVPTWPVGEVTVGSSSEDSLDSSSGESGSSAGADEGVGEGERLVAKGVPLTPAVGVGI